MGRGRSRRSMNEILDIKQQLAVYFPSRYMVDLEEYKCKLTRGLMVVDTA